jgi:two-component system, OmpR family, sensor histidine kinase BaeS
MPALNRSLLFKLSLAFWLVSISGIVIIALLAGRVSQQEFNRFVNEAQYQGLIDSLAKFYAEHQDFTGADYLLEAAQQKAQNGQAHEFIVVDPDGNVLLALVQRQAFVRPYPELINIGFPITVGSEVVARLIPIRPPRSPADTAVENLHRIYNNIFIGAVFATLFALLLGWVMARNIIRPLRELNTATEAIAQGDLEKQVAVSSRDEIGHLGQSFNTMTASLKRSRDLRRQMVADIAHELRNPLSIILGHAEALSEGVLPADPETLDIIYDETKHLSRLVDDLRTLSLSEAGELLLQRSPTAPKDILDRCAAAYAARAADKAVTLQSTCAVDLPKVTVDTERIVQVIFNLLDNSLKHTPAGGSIWISAAAAAGAVEITVQDTGSGIPAEDQPFVFDRFYRGKQSTGRIQDGSGLGLAISRALIELHGGKISVSSAPGQGTTMTFSLPLSQAVE